MTNAIQDRVAQVDVRRRHVDARTEHVRAVGEVAGSHHAEEREVLVDVARAERRIAARLDQGAAHRADLVGRLAVDVRVAGLDQVLGEFVEQVEVIAREVEVVLDRVLQAVGRRRSGLALERLRVPVEPQPADHLDDRVDVLAFFLLRIGVVEAQVTDAAVVARQPEVEADRLRVADVQIAVRLGGKAGADARRIGDDGAIDRMVVEPGGAVRNAEPRGVGAAGEVLVDDVPQEVGCRGRARGRRGPRRGGGGRRTARRCGGGGHGGPGVAGIVINRRLAAACAGSVADRPVDGAVPRFAVLYGPVRPGRRPAAGRVAPGVR